MPVIALPKIKAWMSLVPSYVFTVSRFMACLKTWYYSLIPLAPIISLASLAIWMAFIQLLRFIIEIISTASSFLSLSLETCSIPKVPREISVFIWASLCWISWKEANGTPNCLRSRTYYLALWKQNSAAPRTPQEIPNLALFRHEKGPANPLTEGNIWDLGTLTLSITISPVIEAFSESFPLMVLVERPFMPFSRTNPLMSPFSSFAHTTNTSAIGELVIHILDPFSTYSSPSSFALDFIPPGSDPWSG